MASNVVGTAYVRLRLLTDTIGKDIEKSIKSSDLQDVDIKVKADTAEADAELEATSVKADELDKKKTTVNVDTKQSESNIRALWRAVILLSPAIGPLAGAAAAAFGTFAAEAGVAVLAVKGVEKEIKAGSAIGVAFSGNLNTLKSDLSTLEATAAKGVLPGFETTVRSLNAALPGVNRTVGILSAELGDMAGHVVVGLVAGLTTFEPLLTHVGQIADNAAESFEHWATGPGGAKFAAGLGSAFDQTLPVLESFVQAIGHLVTASVPLGGAVLTGIQALSDVINAIPLPVLRVAAPLLYSLVAATTAMKIASTVSGYIDKLTLSIKGLNAGTATAAASAGGIAGVLLGGYLVAQQFSDQLDKIANQFATGKIEKPIDSTALDDLSTSYQTLTGNVDASNESILRWATSGRLAKHPYDDLNNSIVDVVSHFKSFGVSTDDIISGIGGTNTAFDSLIATIQKHGGATEADIKTLKDLHNSFANSISVTEMSQAALDRLTASPGWGKLATNSDTVAQLAAKFGISANAVQQFASLMGISSDAIKNGQLSQQQLADTVRDVGIAYNTADAAGSEFLDSLQKFSTSAGTAADRAQLIGAYLKNAQGDLLGYQGAVASAYQANRQLTDSFKQENDQVKAGSLALSDTQRAAINLKTGMIDVTKAGAAPLITSLQQMQDAAMKAAEATYQHEVNTRGAGKAAEDAATIFKGQTYDALVKDAAQLGLTSDQAKALAKSYFDVPDDVITKVKALGTDPVVTVLNKIGQQLAYLTHHAWIPTVGIRDMATDNIIALQNRLDALNGKVSTVVINSINKQIGMQGAIGRGHYGGMIGGGAGRIQYRSSGGPAGQVSGPPGRDAAGLFALENGEWVTDAVHTKRYLPLLKAIGADGVASVTPTGSAAAGGMDMTAVVAELRALGAAIREQQHVLVADGQRITRLVNDTNLKQARRL